MALRHCRVVANFVVSALYWTTYYIVSTDNSTFILYILQSESNTGLLPQKDYSTVTMTCGSPAVTLFKGTVPTDGLTSFLNLTQLAPLSRIPPSLYISTHDPRDVDTYIKIELLK